MGETVRLRNQLAGGSGLNDFLRQGDSEATIGQLLRIMLPTVNMRDFQRRHKFDSGSVALAIGQRISSTLWTVPLNENWRPVALFLKNGDTVVHDIVTIITIDPALPVPVNTWQPSRTRVDPATAKVVYGNDQDGTMSGGVNTFWMSKVPVTLEPDDTFGFFDDDVAVSASLMEWTFIYELVPAPATRLVRGVKGAVTTV